MKAWRLYDLGDYRFEEVPLPEIKPGWALVKVKVVQIAALEVDHMKGISHGHAITPTIRKMLSEGKTVRLGHEFCGEVVEIGQGVTTLKVGDRVSYAGLFPCGTCVGCRSGKECLSRLALGGAIPGAFAEYTCVPEQGLEKIPDGPTDNEVAAIQPLRDCAHQVRSADIKMGDTIVVLG
ncbi:MAG: alcohol dehydrogenase catalytic domain-containing protein, partial [Chloroflexota bacterium]